MAPDPQTEIDADLARTTAVQNIALLRTTSLGGVIGNSALAMIYVLLAWETADRHLLVVWLTWALLGGVALFISLRWASIDQRLDDSQLPHLARAVHAIGGFIWGTLLFFDSGSASSQTPLLELCILFGLNAGVMSSNGFIRLKRDVLVAAWSLATFASVLRGQLPLTIGAIVLLTLIVRETRTTERKDAELRALRHRAELDVLDASRRAEIDPLTGLTNRVGLQRLTDALVGGSGPVTAVFVDLDRFKQVNDNLGHQAGDEVLLIVAHRLRSMIHEADVVCRVGGDEFFLLVTQPRGDQTVDCVMTSIRNAIARPITVPSPDGAIDIVVTASVGGTTIELDDFDLDRVYAESDRAMYDAKRVGRRDSGGIRRSAVDVDIDVAGPVPVA